MAVKYEWPWDKVSSLHMYWALSIASDRRLMLLSWMHSTKLHNCLGGQPVEPFSEQ